jgi:hypothetical protein
MYEAVESVWFRASSVICPSFHGIPLRRPLRVWDDRGRLVVGDRSAVFIGDRGEISIGDVTRVAQIHPIVQTRHRRYPLQSQWVLIEYAYGREALFTDGRWLGWAGAFGNDRIFQAVSHLEPQP